MCVHTVSYLYICMSRLRIITISEIDTCIFALPIVHSVLYPQKLVSGLYACIFISYVRVFTCPLSPLWQHVRTCIVYNNTIVGSLLYCYESSQSRNATQRTNRKFSCANSVMQKIIYYRRWAPVFSLTFSVHFVLWRIVHTLLFVNSHCQTLVKIQFKITIFWNPNIIAMSAYKSEYRVWKVCEWRQSWRKKDKKTPYKRARCLDCIFDFSCLPSQPPPSMAHANVKYCSFLGGAGGEQMVSRGRLSRRTSRFQLL